MGKVRKRVRRERERERERERQGDKDLLGGVHLPLSFFLFLFECMRVHGCLGQGCQIFLGTAYQNWKKYQITIKYS
jgi:hypothetical protein